MSGLQDVFSKIPGFQNNPNYSGGIPPMPQYGNPTAPKVQPTYPPAPRIKKQEKPTHLEVSDMKYHALNIDRLSLDIVSRGGFDKVAPDMLIWGNYQYNVRDFKANANEVELSRFVSWSLEQLGLKEFQLPKAS